jgi:putative ABC transport system permease protein
MKMQSKNTNSGTPIRAPLALRETIALAVDSLRAHKMRSFLTLLGVILAVTTLVSVMSIINGLNLYVAEKIANLGANVLIIDRMGIITNFEDFTKAQKRPPLTLDDAAYLREHMQLAAQIGAVEDNKADVRYGNNLSELVEIDGATPNLLEMEDIEAANGRFFTEGDEEHHSDICFVGPEVTDKVMPGLDPIGKSIRVGSEQYQIVGVAKARGTVLGQSQDNFVMLPLGTYRKAWHAPKDSTTLMVQARGPEFMDAAQDEARFLLRAKRHVPYNDPDNFGVITPTSITGLWERLTANIFFIAVSLSSIFFVVGGIVIMNIMLASVTERTREIGLRKSIGARRRHIIMQVLVESSMLSASGGVMGIIIAASIAFLVRAIWDFPITTSLPAIIISLVLATGVGLFFGIFPAMRAARLDPIEALRAET